MTAAFWIDYDYDRENASDGVSRFGAYARRSDAIAECWRGTWDDQEARQARFAVAAWETATIPVMAPGFVRRHPLLLRAQVRFNAWDATLFGSAELVTPWPGSLARPWEWAGEDRWHYWPAESHGGREVFREPDENEIAAGYRFLLPSVRLVFPLRAMLPSVTAGLQDGVETAATKAVEVLVAAMNSAIVPVIEALERRDA